MIYMCKKCGNLIFDNEIPEQKGFHEVKEVPSCCSVYSCNSNEMIEFDGIENVPQALPMLFTIGKSKQFHQMAIYAMNTILKTKCISLHVEMNYNEDKASYIYKYMKLAIEKLKAMPHISIKDFGFEKDTTYDSNGNVRCITSFDACVNESYQSTAETWAVINSLVEKSLEFLTIVILSCIEIDNSDDAEKEYEKQEKDLLILFHEETPEKEKAKEEVEEKVEEPEPESTVESWNPFDDPTPKKEEAKEEEAEPESAEEEWNPFIDKEVKEPEPAPKKKRASRDEIYAALDKGYTKGQIMEEFKVSTKTYNRRKEEWLAKKKDNINDVPEAKTSKVIPEMVKPKTSGYEWKKFKWEDD